MQAWAGVMLSCAALLVVSAIPKLGRPGATITALRSVGMTWVGAKAVALLTVVEVVAGLTAIAVGGRWADVAVAALYAGFSLFLIRALGVPTASCGCTGRNDTPPSIAHLVMTLVFASGATAAVLAGGQTGVVTVVRNGGGLSVLALALALVATWLGWSVLTISPRLALPTTSTRKG
jgi:hypothetical protein